MTWGSAGCARAAAARRSIATVSAAILAMGGFVVAVSTRSGAAPTAVGSSPFVAKGGKLSPRLAELASAGSFTATHAQIKALSVPSSGVGSLEVRPDGRVLVEIRVSGTSTAVVDHLQALGAQVVNVSATYATVTAAISPGALQVIAADPAVRFVSEVLAPQVGHMPAVSRRATPPSPSGCAPIVSEGDSLMNVAAARSHNNVDGAGETIGILSDSFNTNTSAPTHAADDVAAGELPGPGNPCGETNPVVVQSDYSGGDQTDEGRAMAQLAHGLAPGARLAFASANNGELDFASQIANLRNVNHASVIVDDSTYIDEPFFQDGPIANAANAAAAAGVPYFSAAGNSNVVVGGNNVSSYETPSLRPVVCPAGVEAVEPVFACHNFDTTGGTDTGDDITLAPGGEFAMDLQWAQPWGAVTDDYDLFIVNAAGTVVGGSGSDNIRSQKPYEFAGYQNTTASPETVHIVVGQYSGDVTRFKFVLMGAAGITAVQYNASAGGDIVGPSIFGHNGAATVGSTAAIPYNDSTTSEDYSSHGPVTLYYQPTPSTTALGAPQVVNAPAFAATDGVNTSFFGELDSSVWRFYGTSAAAPQAAAIGALLQEKDPALTSAQLMSALSSTARNVANDGSPDAVGGGYLDADAALASVGALPGAPTGVTATSGNAQATVSWNAAATDPNFPLTGYAITPVLGGVPQAPQAAPAGATSQVVTGLSNGASYTFEITASNANGPGPTSPPSGAITVGAPSAPSSASAIPRDGGAIVSWIAPAATNGRPITGYTVTVFAGGSFLTSHTFNSTATSEAIGSLADSTVDTFNVAAINAYGTGPSSAPSTAITIGTPPAPATPAVAPINGGLAVTWKTPNITGEAPINFYFVSVYQDGTTLLFSQEYATSEANYPVTVMSGLTNGSAYGFTVAAVNTWGGGLASTMSAVVVAGSPTAPRSPAATSANGSAVLTWHSPASANGSPLSAYVVTPYLAGVAQAPRTFAANATTRTVTGLTNGKSYTFSILAKNARGAGPASAPTAVITVGVPKAPTGVTAKAGHGLATVHWTAAANNGAPITHYIVTPYKNGVTQPAKTFGGKLTTEKISGLATGQHYTFRVVATNARGSSTASAASPVVKIT